jgi:hypothetical protein
MCMTPGALRRALERRAQHDELGRIVAEMNGLQARKFGGRWRVYLGDWDPAPRSGTQTRHRGAGPRLVAPCRDLFHAPPNATGSVAQEEATAGQPSDILRLLDELASLAADLWFEGRLDEFPIDEESLDTNDD